MQKRFLKTVIYPLMLFTLLGNRPGAQGSWLLQNSETPSGAIADRAVAVPGIDGQTEKQKALADQANRLVDMATDLKMQVAKTNKNILSLDVVRKAEEIELLAHRMKEQSRK